MIVPRSGCLNINKHIKTPAPIDAKKAWDKVLDDNSFAKKMINASLATSAGWKENRPKLSHLLAPPIPTPMLGISTSNNRPRAMSNICVAQFLNKV
jgi:hypothetical protein